MIHINEQGEEWLGEVLDDLQNERNVLCECYTAILIREQMGLSEGEEWK